jgi:hypothetical protein
MCGVQKVDFSNGGLSRVAGLSYPYSNWCVGYRSFTLLARLFLRSKRGVHYSEGLIRKNVVMEHPGLEQSSRKLGGSTVMIRIQGTRTPRRRRDANT